MLAIVIIALPISGLLFPKNPTWKLLNFMKFLFNIYSGLTIDCFALDQKLLP